MSSGVREGARLGVLALAMINVAAIVSARNLPVMAEYGYLTQDLPRYVQQTFRTSAPGPAWAVAGLSEGGSCAIMLALRHPALFGTFADYSGLAGPRAGETNGDTTSTVTQLFGGSRSAFEAHEPSAILATQRFPDTGGWFEVGSADTEPMAAVAALVPLARGGRDRGLQEGDRRRRAHLRGVLRRLRRLAAVDGRACGWVPGGRLPGRPISLRSDRARAAAGNGSRSLAADETDAHRRASTDGRGR